MSKDNGAPSFRSALRGYERDAVDAAVAALAEQRRVQQERVAGLEHELAGLVEMSDAAARLRTQGYAELSRRLEAVLLDADEQTRSAFRQAHDAALQEREVTRSAVVSLSSQAQHAVTERLAEVQQECEEILAAARADAERIRAEGAARAAATAASSGAIVEQARVDAVRAGFELETELIARDEEFDRHVLAREAAADRMRADAELLVRTTAAEIACMPERARRGAEALLDVARAAAAEMVAQAGRHAAALHQEGERELAALVTRRDALYAHLASAGEAMTRPLQAEAVPARTGARGA